LTSTAGRTTRALTYHPLHHSFGVRIHPQKMGSGPDQPASHQPAETARYRLASPATDAKPGSKFRLPLHFLHSLDHHLLKGEGDVHGPLLSTGDMVTTPTTAAS
jgi:hypothetical protein